LQSAAPGVGFGMEIVFVKIWVGFLLLVVLSALYWLYKHQALVRSKIMDNDAMPREAVRGNVLVLVFAGGLGMIGLLVRLLFI
jgi:hypothetical protein